MVVREDLVVVREDLVEEGHEGGEGMDHVDIWQESIPNRKQKKCNCHRRQCSWSVGRQERVSVWLELNKKSENEVREVRAWGDMTM